MKMDCITTAASRDTDTRGRPGRATAPASSYQVRARQPALTVSAPPQWGPHGGAAHVLEFMAHVKPSGFPPKCFINCRSLFVFTNTYTMQFKSRHFK